MNEKGFAATGILYTILILFILVIAGMLTMLYSRNELLIKIKKSISTDVPIVSDYVCQAKNIQSEGENTAGDEYLCDPGDGVKRVFYLLETSGDTVSLIMNQNIDNTTVAWSTTSTNDTEADAARVKLPTNWLNVTVDLPSYNQLSKVRSDNDGEMPLWVYDYLNGTTNSVAGLNGYWTSTPNSSNSNQAWYIYKDGNLGNNGVVSSDASLGVRPVIVVSKSMVQ